jgi:hypothetical protein
MNVNWIEQLRTTELGIQRIRQNLRLDTDDVVAWCKQAVLAADSNSVIRKGKNWYIYGDGYVLTINASSYTIITAHKKESN